MAETTVSPQDQDVDTGRYAGQDDTPAAARLRQLLVRQFATTQAFDGQPVTEFPHLAADTAMRIAGPALTAVTADARETIRQVRAGTGDVAEKMVERRIKAITAAARASERAACVAFLRGEAQALAAAALEARGADVAVAVRDAESLSVAAQSLTVQR